MKQFPIEIQSVPPVNYFILIISFQKLNNLILCTKPILLYFYWPQSLLSDLSFCLSNFDFDNKFRLRFPTILEWTQAPLHSPPLPPMKSPLLYVVEPHCRNEYLVPFATKRWETVVNPSYAVWMFHDNESKTQWKIIPWTSQSLGNWNRF